MREGGREAGQTTDSELTNLQATGDRRLEIFARGHPWLFERERARRAWPSARRNDYQPFWLKKTEIREKSLLKFDEDEKETYVNVRFTYLVSARHHPTFPVE